MGQPGGSGAAERVSGTLVVRESVWRVSKVIVLVAGALAVVWLIRLRGPADPTMQPPDRVVESATARSEEGDTRPSASASRDEVVIGVIAPLTGGKADQGMQFKEAAELAVAELNARGGILGRQVRLRILDDQGRPNEAAAAAQKLVATPGVVAVIGPSSTASASAALPILEKAHLPTISPSASTHWLVTDNECFYLMTLPAAKYAPRVPETAVQEFGARDLAVIHVKDDWGEATTALVDGWAEENGVPVVAEASYTQGARFFKAQLTALLAREPDALVLNTHYVEGALITRQARDLGYDRPIVAQGTVVYPQFLELAGDAAEGTVSWVSFLPNLDIPSVRGAVEKFRAAIDKDPLQYHVNTYDAVHILAAAFEAVGNTENLAAVCEAVSRTRGFPGVVGEFSYGEDRLPVKELFWVVARDGRWVLYYEPRSDA